MRVEEIRPFVRFVRMLDIAREIHWGESLPRDNRLFYTEQGNGKIWANEQVYEMEQGSLLLIPAGCVYSLLPSEVKYLAVNYDYSWEHSQINVPVPPLILKRGDQGELIEHVKFQDAPELDDCLYVPNGFAFRNMLHQMLEEYTRKALYHEVSNGAMLSSLIVSLVRKIRTESVFSGKIDLDEIIAYIQEHYAEKITNRDIAQKFHFHPTYISDTLKKVFGKSLHQYVMERRILAGISMLEENKYSVEEIARTVGFYDCCYFSRYFKKITGMSPKHYQR